MNWRAGFLVICLGMFLISCGSSSTDQTATAPATGATPSEALAGKAAPAKTPAEALAAKKTEIPAGTALAVRVDNALSTTRNKAGDTFTGTLVDPVAINGKDVLPKGTRFKGHVTSAESSGRMKGRATLGITLDSFEWKGADVPVTTSLDTKSSAAHKKRNIELIGGGAGLGALIGGIAGGGKGAAIGAGAGAAAGTGTAYVTGKKEVSIPAETIFNFRVKAPVAVKE